MCTSGKQYNLYAIPPTHPTQNMLDVGKAKMVSPDRFGKKCHLCAAVLFPAWGLGVEESLHFSPPDSFPNQLNITPFIVMLKRSI